MRVSFYKPPTIGEDGFDTSCKCVLKMPGHVVRFSVSDPLGKLERIDLVGKINAAGNAMGLLESESFKLPRSPDVTEPKRDVTEHGSIWCLMTFDGPRGAARSLQADPTTR